MSNRVDRLNTILKSRYHGATALSGFRYQILYSVWRTFDLFSGNTIEDIRFEGIEDIDLRGFNVGNEYVQVKSSSKTQGWGWLNQEKILDKYIEVFKTDRQATFSTMMNFEPTGDLHRLIKNIENKNYEMPAKIEKRIKEIADRCHLSLRQLPEFIKSLKFETISEETIIARIDQAIVEYFDVTTGNTELYLMVLFSRVLFWATQRASLTQEIVLEVETEISDWIAMGTGNPVVHEGWLQPLKFDKDSDATDYYEGKSARPVHIRSNLDVERPRWLKQITNDFENSKVCVIRSSSGQGKSTLALRYAYNNFDQFRVFQLKSLNQASMVNPLKIYVLAKLKLNLPLLIVIDDLNQLTREWHLLASELADENVYFLITTREENWFRYANALHSISYRSVFLDLSFDEAKVIYTYFENAGKVAENVQSVAWAYEKVAERKLLIEFVFLITQGEMLSERLEHQIKTIASLGEDRAKFEILRLISLAQLFDVKVSPRKLVRSLEFTSDPDLVLQSLASEYLVVENQTVEGLHFIRSYHLVRLLHTTIPEQETLEKLIFLVSDDDLSVVIRKAFSSSEFEIDHESLLTAVLERTNDEPGAILSATAGFFEADEQNYFLANKHVYDEIYERFGTAGLTIFTGDTLPATKLNTTESLLKIATGKHENLERTRELLNEISERGELEERVTSNYLRHALETISQVDYEVLPTCVELKIWASFYNTELPGLDQFIDEIDWLNPWLVKALPIDSHFIRVLFESYAPEYEGLLAYQLDILRERYLLESNTIRFSDDREECFIEFIVDEENAAHDQALSRLTMLSNWFPHYDKYHSQGLYPISPIEKLSTDETKKSLAKEVLQDDFNVALNASYIKVVNDNYVSKSIYEWVAYICRLRKSLLVLIEALIARHEDLLSSKSPRNIQDILDDTYTQLTEFPDSPEIIEQLFSEERKSISSWLNHIENFLRQYFNTPFTSSADETRLYRLNLRLAVLTLDTMQNAFTKLLQAEMSYLDYEDIDEREQKKYDYLFDLLEHHAEHSSAYRVPPKVKPRTVIKAWKKRKSDELKSEVRSCLSETIEEGFHIHIPSDFLREDALDNICLGIEINDATNPLAYLEYLLPDLASLEVDYSLLYIMLFVRNRPLYEHSYRLNSNAVQTLGTAEFDTNRISIFPVLPPKEFFEILGIDEQKPVAEYYRVRSASELLLKIEGLRNEMAFLNSRLSMPKLFRDFEKKIQVRYEEIEHKFEDLLQNADQFTPKSSHAEWSTLWRYIERRFDEINWHLISSELLDTPLLIQEDTHIQQLYGEYINSEYLSDQSAKY